MQLTNNQKKVLRSMGHSLKPVVMVGQHGLSASVLAELESSLGKHELLKIKIRAQKLNEKQQIINQIIGFSHAHLIQVIGAIILIYRPFDETPKIILPRK